MRKSFLCPSCRQLVSAEFSKDGFFTMPRHRDRRAGKTWCEAGELPFRVVERKPEPPAVGRPPEAGAA